MLSLTKRICFKLISRSHIKRLKEFISTHDLKILEILYGLKALSIGAWFAISHDKTVYVNPIIYTAESLGPDYLWAFTFSMIGILQIIVLLINRIMLKVAVSFICFLAWMSLVIICSISYVDSPLLPILALTALGQLMIYAKYSIIYGIVSVNKKSSNSMNDILYDNSDI